MGAPPLVSSTWFPPNQRATATAVSTMTSYVGISISFLVGPFVLNPSDVVSSKNDTSLAHNITKIMSNHTSNGMFFSLVCM